MSDIDKITRTVQVGDLAFPVADQGEGPVVVLLHGFPDSRYLWRHQIPVLVSGGLRVIAPDLRGYGDAPKPEEVEGYAIPNVMQEVISILDSLQVEKVYLVGHDWGAVLSWFLTAYYPQRVDKLVALSVGCPGTSGTKTFEQLERAWYAMLFRYGQNIEDLMQANDWEFFRRLSRGDGDQERYFKDLSQPGAINAALNWYRANFNLNFDSSKPFSLPKIQCPVMGIWSEGDYYLTESHVKNSFENIDGTWRYEKIAGASHWLMLDKTEEVNRLLLDFLVD